MSKPTDVLWTYTDRDGVPREWTRAQQEEHVCANRELHEILAAQGGNDDRQDALA